MSRNLVESCWQGYATLRSSLQTIVQLFRSKPLTSFYRKADHWLRIKAKLANVIARRNGITYSLDLAQLIDNQVFFESYFEPETYNVFTQLVKPGMIVLDIGANVGIHTLGLAKLVTNKGRVIAFEPTDWAFRKLERNLSLNPELVGIVQPWQLALSDDSEGHKQFEFRAQWRKAGGYVAPEMGSTEFVTLDYFMEREGLRTVDFVKLDVDGFETKILRGSRSTLALHRPAMIVEMSDFFQKRAGGSAEEMIELLTEFGYAFYHEKNLERIDEGLANLIAELRDWETVNIVCLPS